MKIKIYIDTNIFYRSIDGNIEEKSALSLKNIILKKDKLFFYTSSKTRNEILNAKKLSNSYYLQFIIGLLVSMIEEKRFIDVYENSTGTACFGEYSCAGGEDIEEVDYIFSKLLKIFDKDDAEQIFQAIKSDADYFLTLDHKTILKRKDKYNKLGHKTILVNPSELEIEID
jgi:predicted nucleic acid-binding protein